MPLTGPLLERTQQAILAAYSRADLQRFVRVRLEESFEAITSPADLTTQVFELLLWAERQGRATELLEGLAADRPGSAELAAVAASRRTGAPLPARMAGGPGRPAEADQPGRPGQPRLPPQPVGIIPLQKPRRVQHFTGRDRELARLLADLQPGKVLTLCGPGGVGKTALAAEAV